MVSELISLLLDFYAKYGEKFSSRLCAYVLAPMIVGGVALAQSDGGLLSGDEGRPFSIATLGTEITSSGQIHKTKGAAILIEPATASYRIPLLSNVSRILTSLNEEQATANKDRLRFDGVSLSTTSPLLDTTSAVTVVVNGAIASEIEMPGGSAKASEFAQEPQRASSYVSYVLLSCAFAFGLSIATGFAPVAHAPVRHNKNGRRKKRA